MTWPVYICLGALKLHTHLVFETAAYAIAFRAYLLLRRRTGDALDDANRWWIMAAAAMGAVVGSKALYWFEDPALTLAHWREPALLMCRKNIRCAFFGRLFPVATTHNPV